MKICSCSFLSRLALPGLMSLLLSLTAGLTVGHADIIQSSIVLPPPAGVYQLPTICVPAACVQNATISGFTNIIGPLNPTGDQMVSADAVFFADVYTNNNGSPGTLIGPLTAPGSVDITYVDRNLTMPLGTFTADLTAFDFSGALIGHTFEVMQNPSQMSTGVTTIERVLPVDDTYRVTSFFDIFAQLSIDGGPFVPGQPIPVSLVPEPGYATAAGAVLVGILAFARRRRTR
jgi:hypothetical protein